MYMTLGEHVSLQETKLVQGKTMTLFPTKLFQGTDIYSVRGIDSLSKPTSENLTNFLSN